MNYMMQMNNFWTKRRISRINSSAADLYYALLSVSNSIGWNTQVSVSNAMLTAMTDMSTSTFHRARKDLVDAGYIKYHPATGFKDSTYELIEFNYENLFK